MSACCATHIGYAILENKTDLEYNSKKNGYNIKVYI